MSCASLRVVASSICAGAEMAKQKRNARNEKILGRFNSGLLLIRGSRRKHYQMTCEKHKANSTSMDCDDSFSLCARNFRRVMAFLLDERNKIMAS
jgi:hypothetical protein